MRKFLAIMFSLLMLGCTSAPMPADWAPITTIVERPSVPTLGDTTVSTVSPYLIVKDIDEFWEAYPVGSPVLEALRRHEVIHAESQEAYDEGKIAWVKRYALDRSFRWDEEKRGWKEQILHLRNTGHLLNVGAIAEILSGKGYDMINFAEARQWVLDVLAGRV